MTNQSPTERGLVAGIILLAAVLRFPLLGTLPPGLYHDEAINGLDALRVLDGFTPVFFPANNGREPLFIYLIAGSVAVLGRSALAVRIVSAVLGTLTVPATYLMGRRLFDRRIGLLTAVITAITVWPLNLSRVGFRTVAMPLFVAVMLWAFWRSYELSETSTSDEQSSWRWFALAGVFAGLTLYTYLAARFIPLVFLVFAGYLIFQRRPRKTQDARRNPSTGSGRRTQHPIPWRGFLIFACVAGLVAAPLLGYFVTHRAEAAQRAFQVSIFNPDINHGDPLGTFARHLGRTLMMFNVRGDFIPRHNVPLRPVFDPLLSLFFLLGLVIALRRWRQPAYGMAIIWTAVMLLPTVLAEDAPHFLRAAGVLPVVFVFPAIGLSAAGEWLQRRWSPQVAGAVVAGVLTLSLGLTTYDYFVRHARSENAYYQFEAGAVELARDVNSFVDTNPDGEAYVDQKLWDGWAAIPFLVPQSPSVTVLNDDVLASEPEARSVLLALRPFQDLSRYFRLLPRDSLILARDGAKERGDLEPEARLLYVQLRTEPRDDTGPPLATFGNNILLREADTERLPDGRLRIDLVWECRDPTPADYTVTVQLTGEAGLIAQNDGPPAQGYYPTHVWRAGDQVAEQRILNPHIPYNPASQQIIVALYDPTTLDRLPVTAPDGQLLGDHFTFD